MIKKYFSEDDDSSDNETLKNELLKTIYFPKGTMNIGYLTDKLPKASYEKEFGSLTERRSVENSISSTSIFPAINSSSPIIKHHYKQRKKVIKDNSSVESLSSIRNKKNVSNSPRSIKSKAVELQNSQIKNTEKISTIERIANRIEENKIENIAMNIDKEYNDLK